MTNTTARIRKEGDNFEILVDLEEALKVRKGQGNISAAVLTEAIFNNLKSGEHASKDMLEIAFGSTDLYEISEKIIKNGEVVLPTSYKNEEQEKKYKQVVDFLVRNAVSPEGRPYTPERIMTVLKEANINVKNGPIDTQISSILEKIQSIIPIKVEVKHVKITIPAQYTGKAYGVISEYKKYEEWLGNGDVVVTVEVPSGIIFEFYDRLNNITHGSALTEEIKEN